MLKQYFGYIELNKFFEINFTHLFLNETIGKCQIVDVVHIFLLGSIGVDEMN